MTTQTALLPCPFCGGKPDIIWMSKEDFIQCQNSNCEVQPTATTEKGWNMRGGGHDDGI